MARDVDMAVPGRPTDARPMCAKQKIEYSIKTITPVFGGGVDPGKSDPVSVVRVPAVRGHLRFWWRAVRGSQTGLTVIALRQREAEIWGSASVPSAVDVQVEVVRPGVTVPWAHYERNANGKEVLRVHEDYPAYALFPFQRNEQEHKPLGEGLSGVEFTLRVWVPDEMRLDVEAAVWAWANFGGLGARTRRGCGALFCQELAPLNQTGVKEWFDSKLKMYKPKRLNGGVRWPELRWRPILHPQPQTPAAAWVRAVGALGDYRQKPGIGRNTGYGPRPGRSFWPEADSFRELAPKCAVPSHAAPTTINPATPPLFPRALFGLPIVFQMKGENFGKTIQMKPAVSSGEEHDWITLERMASPIILRSLAFGDGTRARAMALLLTAEQPTGVALESKSDIPPPPASWNSTHLKGPRTRSYSTSPIRRYSTDDDAVSGFFGYLMTAVGFVAL